MPRSPRVWRFAGPHQSGNGGEIIAADNVEVGLGWRARGGRSVCNLGTTAAHLLPNSLLHCYGRNMERQLIPSKRREGRCEPRAQVMFAAGIEYEGAAAQVRVIDLSDNGAAIVCDRLPHNGSWLTFRRQDRAVRGRVAWTRDGRGGLHFAMPMSQTS